MYKKILIPLDGSKFSECSLEHVRAIAKGCQASEVTLLVVIEPPQQTVDVFRNMMETALVKANQYLNQMGNDLQKEGIDTRSEVVEGLPADIILDYANQNQIDLIIMSTHGRSGAGRWLFGSVADRVVHYSIIPVLVLSPPGCRVKG